MNDPDSSPVLVSERCLRKEQEGKGTWIGENCESVSNPFAGALPAGREEGRVVKEKRKVIWERLKRRK